MERSSTLLSRGETESAAIQQHRVVAPYGSVDNSAEPMVSNRLRIILAVQVYPDGSIWIVLEGVNIQPVLQKLCGPHKPDWLSSVRLVLWVNPGSEIVELHLLNRQPADAWPLYFSSIQPLKLGYFLLISG